MPDRTNRIYNLCRAGVSIRRATTADAEVIAWHRARMFQDMGKVPAHLFETFRAKLLPRLRADLAACDYIGWLIPHPENEKTIIAGAGVLLRLIPPFPLCHDSGETSVAEGRQALIVNVFTEPEWRRRGLARLLMEQINLFR